MHKAEQISSELEQCNLPVDIALQAEAATQKERSEPITHLFGPLSQTTMQPPSIANDSPNVKLSNQMSVNSQTTLFALCQHQTYLSGARLVQIFPWLEREPELMAIADVCFIRDSDSCDYSKFRTSFLKMSRGFSAAVPIQAASTQLELFNDTKLEVGGSQHKHIKSRSSLRSSIRVRISSKYSGSLGKWGIAVPGRSATATDGFPKIDREFSLLVVTGNIQCRKIEVNRPTLQSCLDAEETILDQQPSGDRHPFTVVGSSNNGWQTTVESPTLTSSAWLHSPSAETKKSGKRFAVMYRGATGDRTYTEVAPTLRSLANTGGKHQSGGGAWKVVEYKGEDYLVSSQLPEEACSLASTCSHLRSGARPRRLRDGKAALIPTSYRRQRPLSATEFERLMGWPVCSTEKGITASGEEISISKTQRQKMLGNGIIPHEIEDICNKLKRFLASSSPSS